MADNTILGAERRSWRWQGLEQVGQEVLAPTLTDLLSFSTFPHICVRLVRRSRRLDSFCSTTEDQGAALCLM